MWTRKVKLIYLCRRDVKRNAINIPKNRWAPIPLNGHATKKHVVVCDPTNKLTENCCLFVGVAWKLFAQNWSSIWANFLAIEWAIACVNTKFILSCATNATSVNDKSKTDGRLLLARQWRRLTDNARGKMSETEGRNKAKSCAPMATQPDRLNQQCEIFEHLKVSPLLYTHVQDLAQRNTTASYHPPVVRRRVTKLPKRPNSGDIGSWELGRSDRKRLRKALRTKSKSYENKPAVGAVL